MLIYSNIKEINKLYDKNCTLHCMIFKLHRAYNYIVQMWNQKKQSNAEVLKLLYLKKKTPNFIDVTACTIQVEIYRGQRSPRLRAFDIDIALSNRLLFNSELFEDSHACNPRVCLALGVSKD